MAQATEVVTTQAWETDQLWEATLKKEGQQIRRNEDSPSASIGASLVQKMRLRMMIVLNKLRENKRSSSHRMSNIEESFKCSLDSGLGSELSLVKEQLIHTISNSYTQSLTTPSTRSAPSTPSTPSSILRSAPTSPLFKKKISFYEAATIPNTRKRCKFVYMRKYRPQPGCTLCYCGHQFCVKDI